MIAESIFLLPNGTFFVELVVVIIILVFAWKKLLPPLNRALENRQEQIRTSLEAADAAKAEAAAAGDERVALLSEARNQARVHLWYPQKHGLPYPALTCSTDGIDRFLTRNTQVGIRRTASGCSAAPR